MIFWLVAEKGGWPTCGGGDLDAKRARTTHNRTASSVIWQAPCHCGPEGDRTYRAAPSLEGAAANSPTPCRGECGWSTRSSFWKPICNRGCNTLYNGLSSDAATWSRAPWSNCVYGIIKHCLGWHESLVANTAWCVVRVCQRAFIQLADIPTVDG